MTDDIAQFDVVRIPGGLPEYAVRAGAVAVVLEVYQDPYLAYEIEVVDDSGRTLFTGAVEAAWVELVEHPGPQGH